MSTIYISVTQKPLPTCQNLSLSLTIGWLKGSELAVAAKDFDSCLTVISRRRLRSSHHVVELLPFPPASARVAITKMPPFGPSHDLFGFQWW